ncbi:MAG: zinc ribbon domain-containing protein [Planctomycetes bacterium]|nr:zinc ribbon domain-containing protein [Planctomycetota bacterium]
MPTYDYVCDACGHELELFQSISAEPLKACPNCKKKKLRRLIGTGAGILFKGSGFYQTDYRSESYKQKAAAESKSESGGTAAGNSDAKPSSGGDAKPSAKSSAGDAKPSS